MSCFNRSLNSISLPAMAACLFILSATVQPAKADSSVIAAGDDVNDSELCQKARYDRKMSITTGLDLSAAADTVKLQDSLLCFTPDENLYFIAHQEAGKVLGPYGVWYLELKEEFKRRVEDACETMGYQNDDKIRAYDHCVEDRFEELIEPYNDKYHRESVVYMQKRKELAENLVTQCDAALSVKRRQLPYDMRFPLAYYDERIHSLPNWFFEDKVDDTQWIERMGELNASKLMREVLETDCPGDMIYWVTYGL